MRRIKLELCYDGSLFSGWQKQQNRRTIQQELESAVAQLTGESVSVLGSGRTDAGVHALYQVAAFSTSTSLSAETLVRGINAYLPREIRVWRAIDVPESFHPISDVVRKRYRYLINDSLPALPFFRQYSWQYPATLDVDNMKKAAQYLLGKQDFKSFETQGSPRQTTVRTMFDVLVERIAAPFPWSVPLVCDFDANSNQISDQTSGQKPKNLSEFVSDEFSNNLTEKIPEPLLSRIPRELSEKMSEEVSEPLSKQKTTEQIITEISKQKATEQKTTEISEKMLFPMQSMIRIEVEADGFLYNMVRTIAGTLTLFGKQGGKKLEAEKMQDILSACDRAAAGPTAPAHGLYMIRVIY